MSTNWFKDMQDMHKKYGVNKWMQAEQQSDVPIKRLKEYYEVSKIQKGNPLRDDKHSKYAIISGKDRNMILYGYCFKDPQGYFMDYGLVDAERTKDHSKYKGVTNLLQGL